ncbi:MobH family relaxase [Candidatus Nitrotoga sp. 1052]|uniref:MobH family relaxase n=1 Tax=Candidatus Nitrotoga sp. 1052 TaxID=2886964 RepID=UPI001EF511D1|nr:MobH family relaxase [Candidatus Nitrotoga sp. 1052]CAH1073277.1 Conjugal transfer pilus assembly protein TraI [Candidatus Nitrotoga sp. 1052]
MDTLTDRLLRKFCFLPSAHEAVQIKQIASAKRIEDLQRIPRYPPFMEGLPVYAPAELLATQHELTGGIRQLIADAELLATHYNPAMLRLAAFVHLLPASQAHHHRGAGGMLRHSLEVGLWALQQTEGKLIRGVITPQQRRVIEPRWRLAVFLAGICHDLGKVVTDLTVTDRANTQKWRPYHQGVYDWALAHDIENYFLHWQEGRGRHHTNVSSTLIDAVIAKESFDWISDGSTDVVIWLTESLNSNPGQSNQIHDYVVRADQLSVERDLKTMGVAMAGYEIGVPVERYLTDIMRRLVREGVWRINEPSARVWNINGITYLVWPMAGEEIARRTNDEDIPGLPKTPDGILDMMVERGIACMREGDGDPYFYIAPDVLTDKIPTLKLKSIRLRDQALISTMPIAPVAGRVIGSNEAAGRTETHVDAENLAPPQHLSSTSEQVISTGTENPVHLQHVSSTAESETLGPATPVTAEQLTGSMGEMLKVLIDDFRTGKKALNDLALHPEDGCLRLKWPNAFSGYEFTPKQILDGLTERGWMEADSDVAKVGEAEFASGVAKAIRLTRSISNLFPQRATTAPQCATINTVFASDPQLKTKAVRQPVTSDASEQQNIVTPPNSKPRKRAAPKPRASSNAAIKDQSSPPVDLPGQIAKLNELLQAAQRDGKELTKRDINLLVQQKVGVKAAAHFMRGIRPSGIPELRT